jgi:hypothetical protein
MTLWPNARTRLVPSRGPLPRGPAPARTVVSEPGVPGRLGPLPVVPGPARLPATESVSRCACAVPAGPGQGDGAGAGPRRAA